MTIEGGGQRWPSATPPRPQHRSSHEIFPSLSPCLSLICPLLGRWGGDAARLSKPVQCKDRKSQANTPQTTTEAKYLLTCLAKHCVFMSPTSMDCLEILVTFTYPDKPLQLSGYGSELATVCHFYYVSVN